MLGVVAPVLALHKRRILGEAFFNQPQVISIVMGGINHIWVWVNTYRYIFSGMNIHLPAILGFTRYQGFDPSPYRSMGVVYDFALLTLH